MKTPFLVSILLIGALMIGLFLPNAAILLQESESSQAEPAGITAVNLTVGSGLSHMEKLRVLSDPNCTVMNVGVGQHQTPATLSQHSWQLLELILSTYGAPILDAGTTQQTEQFAMMASADNQPLIYWEVLFSDDFGNRLRLHLDDETGLPLAMSYHSTNAGAEQVTEWCILSLAALSDLCGLSAAVSDYEGKTTNEYQLPVTDGSITCDVLVQVGDGWFMIGNQIG